MYWGRWRKASARYLRDHPFCAACEAEGFDVPATVTDHVIPHRGDERLFWNEANWQALCKRHHDRKTAIEDGGFGNERAETVERVSTGDPAQAEAYAEYVGELSEERGTPPQEQRSASRKGKVRTGMRHNSKMVQGVKRVGVGVKSVTLPKRARAQAFKGAPEIGIGGAVFRKGGPA